jgi:glycosyltransferase involved in cell wall biosynthesis
VLNQTFQDWQCVISDNASTDSTVEIAMKYESMDSRFKVRNHETNAGAAINWNRSKENNNSFATKLLCADDYLLEDALEIQLDILKKNQTSIVFSERYIVFPNVKSGGIYVIEDLHISDVPEYNPYGPSILNYLQHLQRDDIKSLNIFNNKICFIEKK